MGSVPHLTIIESKYRLLLRVGFLSMQLIRLDLVDRERPLALLKEKDIQLVYGGIKFWVSSEK